MKFFYFIWKYLKATWIKPIANEGCNCEHVKCFESFLLQTFKHKDCCISVSIPTTKCRTQKAELSQL